MAEHFHRLSTLPITRLAMIEAGSDWLDIGGESIRPDLLAGSPPKSRFAGQFPSFTPFASTTKS